MSTAVAENPSTKVSSSDYPLTWADWKPFGNNWSVSQEKRPCCSEHNEMQPVYDIDGSTRKKYYHISSVYRRTLNAIGVVANPFITIWLTIQNVCKLVKDIFLLAILYPFWRTMDGEKKYNFQARLWKAGHDLTRSFTCTMIELPHFVLDELCFIYGIFKPLDARKLLCSIMISKCWLTGDDWANLMKKSSFLFKIIQGEEQIPPDYCYHGFKV